MWWERQRRVPTATNDVSADSISTTRPSVSRLEGAEAYGLRLEGFEHHEGLQQWSVVAVDTSGTVRATWDAESRYQAPSLETIGSPPTHALVTVTDTPEDGSSRGVLYRTRHEPSPDGPDDVHREYLGPVADEESEETPSEPPAFLTIASGWFRYG